MAEKRPDILEPRENEWLANTSAKKDNTRIDMRKDLFGINSEKIVVDLSRIGAIPVYEKGKISLEREMFQLTFRTNVVVTIYNLIVDEKLKIGKALGGTVYEVNLERLKAALAEDQLFIRAKPKDKDDFMSYNYWENILRQSKPETK